MSRNFLCPVGKKQKVSKKGEKILTFFVAHSFCSFKRWGSLCQSPESGRRIARSDEFCFLFKYFPPFHSNNNKLVLSTRPRFFVCFLLPPPPLSFHDELFLKTKKYRTTPLFFLFCFLLGVRKGRRETKKHSPSLLFSKQTVSVVCVSTTHTLSFLFRRRNWARAAIAPKTPKMSIFR